MRKHVFPIILVALISFNTVAQTALDEVVVSSPRLDIPFSENSKSVTIITAEQIATTPVTSFADLLRFQAGLDIRRQGVEGAQADVYLRGGTFDQVLLLIDGIRVDDPQTGHHTLNSALPLEVIERVEIVKGPSARFYGQNAFTGAINIVTKRATENKTTIYERRGSYGTNQLGVTHQLANDNSQHIAHASYNSSDGYRYNTDFRNLHFFTHSSFGTSQKYKLITMFNERKFGANGFYGVTSAKDQYEETQSSLVALTTSVTSKNTTFTPRVFWKRGQDEYVYIRNNPGVYRNVHINNKVGVSLDTNIAHNNGNRTGFGVELSTVAIQSNNLGQHSRTIAHLFLEHRITLNSLSLTPGFALSHFSDVDTFFYPGLDIGYALNNASKLTFNTGYTYRVPTYNDLYYNGPQAIGNADLKPEKALSHELAYRHASSNWSIEAAVFQRNSENLIDYVEVTPADPKWLASNVQEVSTFGGELISSFAFAIGKQKQRLTLSYAYVEDDYTKTVVSRYALNALKHNVNIQLLKSFSPRWSSTTSYRHASRALGGNYQVVNAQLAYTTGDWSIQLQGRNLFNAEYVENLIPMPKGHAVISLQYSF